MIILTSFVVHYYLFVIVLCENETIQSSNLSLTIDKQTVDFIKKTRRILNGREVGSTRPYMVYLTRVNQTDHKNWVCGGVIVHERHILTSAACIEDAKQFYVIAGTDKWTDDPDRITNNECLRNGKKKAVWKCVPKTYFYDGREFNNIRWMIDDIAIVKVEGVFNFKRKIKGCDYVPRMIAYNNESIDLEKAGTLGSIAGWGTTDKFGDIYADAIAKFTTDKDEQQLRDGEYRDSNAPRLLETNVLLLDKDKCKRQWEERYHYIIDKGTICCKDSFDVSAITNVCTETQVNCEELIASSEDLDTRRDTPHFTRRISEFGGFCENDHGGPLIVGRGTSAVVIGTITATRLRGNNKCRGPYIFTSVFAHRNMISCAIYKEMSGDHTCRKYLKNTQTTDFDWSNHKEGHRKAKQVKKNLRMERETEVHYFETERTTRTTESTKTVLYTRHRKPKEDKKYLRSEKETEVNNIEPEITTTSAESVDTVLYTRFHPNIPRNRHFKQYRSRFNI